METKSTTWENIKKVGVFICSVGAGMIGGNIVKMTTPATIGLLSKFCIGAGGVALSGMMAEQTSDYVEKKLDEISVEVSTSKDAEVVEDEVVSE